MLATRTRVKICGLTNLADAVLAAELGADATGMIFYPPSVRSIEMGQAAEIGMRLPAFVTRVGVFVDPDVDYIKSILDQVELDLLQFHGSESSEYCTSFGMPYIKAVQMSDKLDLVEIVRHHQHSRAILVDTPHPTLAGGTGESFDWKQLSGSFDKPIILAGGLRAANVGDAIRIVSPYAVDVSSGVERQKGIKDSTKLKQFMRAVQDTHREFD